MGDGKMKKANGRWEAKRKTKKEGLLFLLPFPVYLLPSSDVV